MGDHVGDRDHWDVGMDGGVNCVVGCGEWVL